MKPYYERDGITIYHGDCHEVLPGLAPVDLVLTDPPYGIAATWVGGESADHGWAAAGRVKDERNAWDAAPPDPALIAAVVAKGRDSVVWGGNHFDLPRSRGWLVWTKPERNFTLSEAELAWTTRDNVIRVFDGPRSDYGRQHPTQKPLTLMRWCLGLFPNATTVLDPFMGSGTTLRAALDLGRCAIGIEIEERYCEIAAERLRQAPLPMDVPPAAPAPEQVALAMDGDA